LAEEESRRHRRRSAPVWTVALLSRRYCPLLCPASCAPCCGAHSLPALALGVGLGLGSVGSGDLNLVQMNAILRHVGRKYGLYGATEREHAVIDMLLDAAEELRAAYLQFIFSGHVTPHPQPSAQRSAHAWLTLSARSARVTFRWSKCPPPTSHMYRSSLHKTQRSAAHSEPDRTFFAALRAGGSAQTRCLRDTNGAL
jgi:hypothetical protein